MNQQFEQKASRLFDRINSIYGRQKKQKPSETSVNTLNKTQFTATSASVNRVSSPLGVSPQIQTILQLVKIEQDICQNEQQNIRKFKSLNQQVRKLEIFIKQEAQTRIKIHESFVSSVSKAEKNMQGWISNVRKFYLEKQKKLQLKIENALKIEKKQILDDLQTNVSLQQGLSTLKQSISELKAELQFMKRSRIQLQQKISKQFSNQIQDLRNIFSASVKVREEKELKILDLLKNIYKKHMDSLRQEDSERETNEKMFLTVIQQLIDRITQA